MELHQGRALIDWAEARMAALPRKKRRKAGRMSPITPLLFVGNRQAAHDESLLTTHRIDAVVNVGGGHNPFPDRPAYLRRVLPDRPGSDMLSLLPELSDFIHSHHQQGRRVLVHCMGGISRSPTVCAAYLVRHRELTLDEALAVLKLGRPTARPNHGFLTQLRRWEARCAE